VALLQQVLLELLELFELLELLELLDLLRLLELSKLLELLKLPKLVLQLLRHTPARAARRATGAMTCCCAKPARFLLWDPTSTHDLATEDHMQRLNARRTENSEGWAVRAHIGASPLLQKHAGLWSCCVAAAPSIPLLLLAQDQCISDCSKPNLMHCAAVCHLM
jgi:hypothetical protein